MNNYILTSGKWIKQTEIYNLPSTKEYWCINLYDDDLNFKGAGYYKKNNN